MRNWMVGAVLGLTVVASAQAAQLNVETTRETLDAPGRSPWEATTVGSVFKDVGPFSTLGASASTNKRYGQVADGLDVFGAYVLKPGMALEAHVRGSSGADFMVKKGAELTLYTALPGDFEGTVGIVHNDYARDSIDLFKARVGKEFGAWRAEVGGTADLTNSARMGMASIGYTASKWSITVAGYYGRETDRSETGVVTLLPVRAMAVTQKFELQKDIHVLLGATKNWATNARQGVTLGLSFDF